MKLKLICVLSATFAVAAHGAEFSKSSDCVARKRMTDRTGKSGIINEVRNGLCVVGYDDGSERSSLHWMPSSPGSGAEADSTATDLVAGKYVCSATGAGTFIIAIVSASRYKDKAGSIGDFTLQDNKQIVFRSGSLAGQYSERLRPGKFGLSSAQGKSFYTVCNFRHPDPRGNLDGTSHQ